MATSEAGKAAKPCEVGQVADTGLTLPLRPNSNAILLGFAGGLGGGFPLSLDRSLDHTEAGLQGGALGALFVGELKGHHAALR